MRRQTPPIEMAWLGLVRVRRVWGSQQWAGGIRRQHGGLLDRLGSDGDRELAKDLPSVDVLTSILVSGCAPIKSSLNRALTATTHRSRSLCVWWLCSVSVSSVRVRRAFVGGDGGGNVGDGSFVEPCAGQSVWSVSSTSHPHLTPRVLSPPPFSLNPLPHVSLHALCPPIGTPKSPWVTSSDCASRRGCRNVWDGWVDGWVSIKAHVENERCRESH